MRVELLDDRAGGAPLVGATRDAIEAIYRRSYPDFLRVATAITADEAEAADAVQDAFASALRSRRGYRGSGSLDAWLWRVVVNAARKRRAARPNVSDASAGEPAGGSDDPGDESVRALVAALPERQRLVLFLRYYADLDYRAIGRVLGIRSGTVGATLSAAHQALRAHLEDNHE